jgi:hypothetical protein
MIVLIVAAMMSLRAFGVLAACAGHEPRNPLGSRERVCAFAAALLSSPVTASSRSRAVVRVLFFLRAA